MTTPRLRRLADADAALLPSLRTGDPDIDRLLCDDALRDQECGVSVTYLLWDRATRAPEDGLVGYVTVTAAALRARDMVSNRQARSWPPYALPMLRVGRMGVRQTRQGEGLGGRLLGEAIRIAQQQADLVGCVGVLVDAKVGVDPSYARYGFREIKLREGQSRDYPLAMYLLLQDVPTAPSR